MELTWVQVLVLLLAGALAGFVNTMAGGGSFISLYALDYVGLPIGVANGTNRIAIQVQNIMAVLGFRSKGVSDVRLSLQLALPTLVGAVVGTYAVIELPDEVLSRVLGVAMLAVLVTMFVDTRKLFPPVEGQMSTRRRVVGYLTLFAVGLYGGAIQAGVGFLLIGALILVLGQNLVRINAYKVFITGIYTLFALALFALRGQVNWTMGLVLGVGDGTGAWIASRLQVERGEGLVKAVLAVMLLLMAAQYLGLVPRF